MTHRSRVPFADSLTWLAAASVLVAMGIVGCADDLTCDPGQSIFEGACVPGPSTGGGPGAGGSGGPGGAPGAAGGPSFGTVCRTNEHCADPAPFCAALPGEEGICTVRGCRADPSVCPDDYECQEPVPTYDLCLPAGL